MSDRDGGRLRGSVGRGSLLPGPTEQRAQDGEHRESQVCAADPLYWLTFGRCGVVGGV